MTNKVDAIYNSIQYMEQHIKDPLTIGDMADYIGYSKYHYSRTFKDITGIGPYDYLRGRKVTEAIEYMLTENKRIIDAAFEYGFSSPEVFTRACLSALQMSPSQIKRSIEEFEGVLPLTLEDLQYASQYKNIQVQESMLPALILKGQLYQTMSPEFKPDLTNPETLKWFNSHKNNDQHIYYILHWPNVTTGGYNHLLGISVTETNNTPEIFSEDIIKMIPANMYLIFPTICQEKELTGMRNYIYNHHISKNGRSNEMSYEIEAVKIFDGFSVVQDSMMHIPLGKVNNPKRR